MGQEKMPRKPSRTRREQIDLQPQMNEFILSRRLVHGILLGIVGLYLISHFDRWWIPHDCGLVGQTAERVLVGELPHRDFDEPYTGGLSVMHACAFKVFGVSLYSLRVVLVGFSLLFTSVVYLIASRLASPWIAAAITILAVVWSVPNYYSPLPSWYNLFFAAFGTWALIKFDETEHKAWLVVAGCMGGISFLMKISGLYFVAASLLFLVYREQDASVIEDSAGRSPRYFSLFSTLALLFFVAAIAILIHARWTLMDVLHFWMPGAILSSYLILNEWRKTSGPSSRRFANLFRTLFGFGLGSEIG